MEYEFVADTSGLQWIWENPEPDPCPVGLGAVAADGSSSIGFWDTQWRARGARPYWGPNPSTEIVWSNAYAEQFAFDESCIHILEAFGIHYERRLDQVTRRTSGHPGVTRKALDALVRRGDLVTAGESSWRIAPGTDLYKQITRLRQERDLPT